MPPAAPAAAASAASALTLGGVDVSALARRALAALSTPAGAALGACALAYAAAAILLADRGAGALSRDQRELYAAAAASAAAAPAAPAVARVSSSAADVSAAAETLSSLHADPLMRACASPVSERGRAARALLHIRHGESGAMGRRIAALPQKPALPQVPCCRRPAAPPCCLAIARFAAHSHCFSAPLTTTRFLVLHFLDCPPRAERRACRRTAARASAPFAGCRASCCAS